MGGMMAKHDGGGWDPDDPRNDRIYLGILSGLMATVMIGAILAIAGDMVFHDPVVKDVGFGSAVLAGVIYFMFRIWGRMRARQYLAEKRRRDLVREPDDDEFGE